MAAAQLTAGAFLHGAKVRNSDFWCNSLVPPSSPSVRDVHFRQTLDCPQLKTPAKFRGQCRYSSSVDYKNCSSFSCSLFRRKKSVMLRPINQSNSDCNLLSYDAEDAEIQEELAFNPNGEPGIEKTKNDEEKIPSTSSQVQDVKKELVMLSLPAIAGQAIDPFVQLMETAYIGHLGSVELASAGVSITVYNTISKLFNIPLLSVATSFVAEDISKNMRRTLLSDKEESTNSEQFKSQLERPQLPSVSTALLLAIGIGIFEALAMSLGSGSLFNLMGISSASPMYAQARKFLTVRAFGAPAFVVSLALQGIFRGFKDTKTPVYCLGFGNFTALLLFPVLIYYCGFGVSGAAMATVISQYIVTFSLLYCLNKKAVLLPPKFGDLQFGDYLKSGGFLIGRTLSVLITMTIATSMAARQGPVAMAAHQICFQVWLAVSLLTDALAASSQALVAGYSSKGDYVKVKEITHYVLKIGLFTGIFLAAVLGLSFSSLASIFTKDEEVLRMIRTGILFVSASQPINALAFVFDGLHFGVSDFSYAAFSMMLVGAVSSSFLLYASTKFGLPGVWSGLTLFMGLRMIAGFVRILTKNGPWWFLHAEISQEKIYSSGAGQN